MALKSAVIFAMLLGLVTYARSTTLSGPPFPSRVRFEEQLKRTGYFKVRETGKPPGRFIEKFELHAPSRPHYHTMAWIDLICRGDQVVSYAHDESFADVPD